MTAESKSSGSCPNGCQEAARIQRAADELPALAAAKAPHDKAVVQGHIDATGRQIDRLVQALQGLTEDETSIVEEAAG